MTLRDNHRVFDDATPIPDGIAKFVDDVPKQWVFGDDFWRVYGKMTEVTLVFFVFAVVFVGTFSMARSADWTGADNWSFHYFYRNKNRSRLLGAVFAYVA